VVAHPERKERRSGLRTERPRHSVAGLRQRIDSLRASGPVDDALVAGMLTVDVADAYRTVLLARDRAAARLHAVFGWSVYALARVIYGDGSHAHRVLAAVTESTPDGGFRAPSSPSDVDVAEADLRDAQAEVEELRSLLTDARRLAAAHIRGAPSTSNGRPEFGLPVQPLMRLRAIAEQRGLVESYRIWLLALRNQAAASLAEHAGWPVPEVAALARTTPEQVLAARPAVTTLHVTYADPGTVVELGDIIDSMNGRLYALGELRVDAIRTLLRSGTPSRTVAAYGQIPPSEVEDLRPAPGPRIVNPWLEDLDVPARRSDARRRQRAQRAGHSRRT